MTSRPTRLTALVSLFLMLAATALPALILRSGGERVSRSYERLTLHRHKTDRIEAIGIEEYTAGVCSVICASESSETLCALAIAVRTRALLSRGCPCGSDFCDSAGVLPYSDNYEEEVLKAVSASAGIVLVLDGALAPAMFHQSSYLVTENAFNATGRDIPCLVSVSSSENAPVSRVEVSSERLALILSVHFGINGFGTGESLTTELNNSGRVKTVTVCGIPLDGGEFARAVGLSSLCYVPEKKKDGYLFTVRGEGSGLGLSIAGAEALAASGYTCKDILMHYYRGCVLAPAHTILA